MITIDNKQVNKASQKGARLVLQAVKAIARSNASSLCRGLLYEPKVPTQLKNEIRRKLS
ncbi:cyclic lactone autoinducer peptide [Candidatus Weimeria sp. HCP3S3_B5]|uniref:cyclic lactone autoinducer peptide n=1 Tax=Candidatus Weimeria sp. HCP3S3_B5 TaxID=3438871 RepID=UPI003F8AEA8B